MNNALTRFLFCCYYFLFWILYFVVARIIFLGYYFAKTEEIGFLTALKTFYHGFQLDCSFASYLSILPFLLIVFTVFLSPVIIAKIIKYYTFFVLLIINVMLVIDLGLYKPWGTRLDATFLTYINTPEVMLASVSGFQLILGLVFWLLLTAAFIILYRRRMQLYASRISKGKWVQIPVFLILAGALIIPLRGGLQTIPVNESNVYFSDKMFANHAAINFGWNFFNAITKRAEDKNPYIFYNKDEAESVINKTRSLLLTADGDSILNTAKPNVILIVWESLTAKLVGSLGGEPTVTENLNRLSNEGILFTNFYGNGDRTDKGIPAILSGYYPQPTKSIMKMPAKTRKLPFLSQKMMDLGYKTSFYYGGDLNFGNMNTYLRNGGISDFTDGNVFDKKDWNSKWGVHDHVLLKRFTEDLSKTVEEPFFKILLTLSSHEPFEFPQDYKFGKNTEVNKFRSAHSYTDKVLGEFIENAKKQPWWKNTLIVIMADHGHGMPEHKGEFNGPKKFQIPMLWLGGALAKTNIKVDNFSSQIDFSYTLLDLLKANTSDFKYGKNIFNSSDKQYALYNFNNGFGIMNKQGTLVYDLTGNKSILLERNVSSYLDSLGKAITQNAYQDFLDRR